MVSSADILNARILLVDDKEANVRLIEGMLRVADYTWQWFREAGAIAVEGGQPGVPALTTHAYGGTRMGDDPDANVVNRWGFSHEIPNLGILGASVMGTSGARNPTLTAQALAWRTAVYLVKKIGRAHV